MRRLSVRSEPVITIQGTLTTITTTSTRSPQRKARASSADTAIATVIAAMHMAIVTEAAGPDSTERVAAGPAGARASLGSSSLPSSRAA